MTCYKALLCSLVREITNLEQTKVYTLHCWITIVTFSTLTSWPRGIVTSLKLQNIQVSYLPKQQCYITLKDHKKDFASNPKTRLINQSYSDLGQISKCIVDKINTILRKSNKYLQLRTSQEVINWYKTLWKHKFMKLDTVEFYPSILEKQLKNALTFANESTEITE